MRHRIGGAADFQRRAVQLDLPADGRIDAEYHARQLRAPGAHKAGKPQYFAGM